MGAVVRALTVAAVLTPSACGGSASYDENAAIPADAWPTLDGVTVVSDGSNGSDCSDTQQTGGRVLKLKTSVAAATAIDFLASGLTEAGRETYDCTRQTVCRTHDGMLAVFRDPDEVERKRSVEVTVKLARHSTVRPACGRSPTSGVGVPGTSTSL